MSDTGGWTTPEGWGGPSTAAAPPQPPAPGQQQYGPSPTGYPHYSAPQRVKPGVVPLRPLGLGEVLDGAVGILRRYPRPSLGLAAIVALVSSLLNLVLLTTVLRPLFELDQTALGNGDTAQLEQALGGAAAGGLLSAVLGLLSGAIMTGVITVVVGKAVLGAPIDLAQAWRLVRPRLLPLIGLSLLYGVLTYGTLLGSFTVAIILLAVGGPVTFFITFPLILAGFFGGIYLYGRLALAPCALVLEGAGIRESLSRSSLLVRGDWWRVFGILILTLVIGFFVSNVLQVPFALFGAGSPGALFSSDADVLATRSLIFSSIGGLIAGTLVTPFTAGVRALLYVDRRMRAEGLDVSLTAAAAAGGAAG